jgi:hypothetical protein
MLAKESGRSRLDIFKDMLVCYRDGGFTWLNYATFGFHKLKDPKIRGSYLSQSDTDDNTMRLNTPKSYAVLRDKGEQYRLYREFIGRDFVDLRYDGEEAFCALFDKHEILFVKPPIQFGGTGIERFESKNVTDKKALMDRLIREGKYIVEEGVVQHEEMNRLSINSVNTIRIASCVGPDGKVGVPYMTIRISLSDDYCDNGSVGGAWTLISDFRTISHQFYSNVGHWLYVDRHPVTGFVFKGFEVPMAQEVIELVKKAAAVLPEARYVGWDIAVTPDGPVIIEANYSPSVELYQVYGMMKDDLGLAETIEGMLGMTLRRQKLREEQMAGR